MRRRNKCGLFLSLCMAVAWTTQAQTSADGYVIAVEGDVWGVIRSGFLRVGGNEAKSVYL